MCRRIVDVYQGYPYVKMKKRFITQFVNDTYEIYLFSRVTEDPVLHLFQELQGNTYLTYDCPEIAFGASVIGVYVWLVS